MSSGTLWIGLFLLLGTLALELLAPNKLKEGFQAIQAVPATDSTSILVSSFPRRGDVAAGREFEAVKQDPRYFVGYADIQRIGAKHDFCRMLVPLDGDEKGMFFACALAGTAGLPSTTYRTKTVADGLRISRDDYMRDLYKEGREAYCRILRGDDGTFQPLCLRAGEKGFGKRDEVDPNPPDTVQTILDFYSGAVVWFRFYDDMLDYTGNITLQKAGKIAIEEFPARPLLTRGLSFNGRDQFLRFGDTSDLTLGSKLSIRSLRAFSVWVYFDEFTNNAHIFDLGNGAGRDNVFLGILGKGDPDIQEGVELRSTATCGADSVVPRGASGAQPVPDVSPMELMLGGSGNVDEFTCVGMSVLPRRLPPSSIALPTLKGTTTRATLLYEVWDSRLRKMQIKVNRAIPLKKWTHICITARSADALRPDVAVYVNGNLVAVEPSGHLPQPTTTSHNYIGKSNWASDSSQYELRDELFHGSMFDFRMYESPMSESKLQETLVWGGRSLGIQPGTGVSV